MATTSISQWWTHDVFVSFRGEDIRKRFMDHLFKDFKQKGINAFKDDNQLPRGEEISHQLIKAIENSRFLIVIFSKNYASSSWCLRELVKILDCKKKQTEMGKYKHEVRIIFYDVKPAVVRNQTDSYAEALAKHECSNRTEVVNWKEALFTAASLSGWDLEDMSNGYESRLIDNISGDILEKLCNGPLHVGENLVGLDERLNTMNLERFIGSSKVNMIGICGVGGIGKTTLAKAIYNRIYVHFERYFFCENVKEHGLDQVLMKLIDGIMNTRVGRVSDISQGIMVLKEKVAKTPVLIILDDVDNSKQLQALAGSPSWFFPGSLIIFTSKDRQLLCSNKVDEIYEMGYLDDGEALELFSLHAFYEKHPDHEFKSLSDRVVQYVQGHPLALKVMGNFLYKKSTLEWASEVDRLQVYPNADIQQVLRLSYDALAHDQKTVFLDVASSFIGANIDLTASVLDSCNLFGYTNMKVLADKSLVTISRDGSLQMHDLIQAMAKEIVREESNMPGERSRLWIPSEVSEALNKNKVTNKVKVLVLLLEKAIERVHNIDCKSFASMENLLILKICDTGLENFKYSSEFKLANESTVTYSGNLKVLSNELRLLYWHGYPFKLLPSEFYPENIVAIDLSYSNIKSLWTSPMGFKKLKVMTLRHCHKLTNTPDFTEISNLEELVFEGCVNLIEVHRSIGTLKRLVILNLRDCIRLRTFPSIIEMFSLEVLIISGCLKIDKLPKAVGTLKNLVKLCVDRTGIKELPSSASPQRSSQALTVEEHEGVQSRWRTFIRRLQHPTSFVLPTLASLQSLKHLDVSYCDISEINPDSIGGLSYLQHLNLSGNNFITLPANLNQLSNLTMLGLVGCKNLVAVPELPPNILHLDAIDCTALLELDNQRVTGNEKLSLDFSNCPELVKKYSIESIISMYLPKRYNSMCFNLHLLLKGGRIPSWFTNQTPGNCVTVQLPEQWCYSKFRRYVVCVAFRPKNRHFRNGSEIRYDVKNFNGASLDICYTHLGTPFTDSIERIVGSDMIWLHHFKPRGGWKDAVNFVSFVFTSEADIEVTECGARLVCDEDIQEEIGSNMIQGHRSPTPDDVVFQSSHERISEINEDEPVFKKKRIV